MSLTITKTKAAPKAKAPKVEATPQESFFDPEKMTIEELADAYGKAEDDLRALKMRPEFARFELVSAELTKRLKTDLKPEQEAQVIGQHYMLEVGAAAKAPSKVADILKVRKFMGDKTFFDLCSVTLTDVRKYLTPEQCAQVIEESNTYTDRRKIAAKFIG